MNLQGRDLDLYVEQLRQELTDQHARRHNFWINTTAAFTATALPLGFASTVIATTAPDGSTEWPGGWRLAVLLIGVVGLLVHLASLGYGTFAGRPADSGTARVVRQRAATEEQNLQEALADELGREVETNARRLDLHQKFFNRALEGSLVAIVSFIVVAVWS